MIDKIHTRHMCVDLCRWYEICGIVDTFVTCDSTERARPSQSNTKSTTHTLLALQNYKELFTNGRRPSTLRHGVKILRTPTLWLNSSGCLYNQATYFLAVKSHWKNILHDFVNWVQSFKGPPGPAGGRVDLCVTLTTVVIEILVARNGKYNIYILFGKVQ